MRDCPVLLLAAGGHASVVLDTLRRMGIEASGIVDPARIAGSLVMGVPVMGDDAWLDQQESDGFLLANGLGTQPGSTLRRDLYLARKHQGFEFASVCHPSAVLGAEVTAGEGSQIMAGSVLQCNVRIGVNAVINTHTTIEHDSDVGDHAFLGPGVVLCGGVVVGEHAFVGAGATVLPGVRVGSSAVIGAGSVVIHDVPPGARVMGNPAITRRTKEILL